MFSSLKKRGDDDDDDEISTFVRRAGRGQRRPTPEPPDSDPVGPISSGDLPDEGCLAVCGSHLHVLDSRTLAIRQILACRGQRISHVPLLLDNAADDTSRDPLVFIHGSNLSSLKTLPEAPPERSSGAAVKETRVTLRKFNKPASTDYAILGLAPTTYSEHPRFLAMTHGLGVWDFETRKLVHTIEGVCSAWSMLFVPQWDDIAFAGGTSPTDVLEYDLVKGVHCGSYKGHRSFVNGLSCIIDTNQLASCCNEASVKLWDRHTRGELKSVKTHSNGVSMDYCPEKHLLLVGISGGHIEAWDPRKMEQAVFRLTPHCSGNIPWDLTRVGDTTWASVDSRKEVNVWSIQTQKVLATVKLDEGDCKGIVYLGCRGWVAGSAVDSYVMERYEFLVGLEGMFRDRVVVVGVGGRVLRFSRLFSSR